MRLVRAGDSWRVERQGADFFWGKAAFPERPYGEGLMRFRETSPGVVGEEWAVVEGGRGVSEGAPEQKLAEGAGDEVCAAHNFSNVKEQIIEGGRELIGGEAIFTPDQKVAKHFACNGLLRPLTPVFKA